MFFDILLLNFKNCYRLNLAYFFDSLLSIVEEDNRILATGFDCRQNPLCDANAICTTDPLNKDRHVCVCNNGFQGNGSSCHGQRKISAFLNFRFCRATFRLGIGFSSTWSTAVAQRLAPCKEIRIPESRKFLLVESGILVNGLLNPESYAKLESRIHVPLTKPKSVPEIRNLRRGIQNPRLSRILLHGARAQLIQGIELRSTWSTAVAPHLKPFCCHLAVAGTINASFNISELSLKCFLSILSLTRWNFCNENF